MTKLSIKADGTTLYKRPRNKRKERKWRKPEDKPKHPLSAYNMFFQFERARLIGEAELDTERTTDAIQSPLRLKSLPVHSSKTARGGTSKRGGSNTSTLGGFAGLAKGVAARWKTLDATSKAMFEERAQCDKRRYQIELTQWKQKQTAVSAPCSDGAIPAGASSSNPIDCMDVVPEHTTATTVMTASEPRIETPTSSMEIMSDCATTTTSTVKMEQVPWVVTPEKTKRVLRKIHSSQEKTTEENNDWLEVACLEPVPMAPPSLAAIVTDAAPSGDDEYNSTLSLPVNESTERMVISTNDFISAPPLAFPLPNKPALSCSDHVISPATPAFHLAASALHRPMTTLPFAANLAMLQQEREFLLQQRWELILAMGNLDMVQTTALARDSSYRGPALECLPIPISTVNHSCGYDCPSAVPFVSTSSSLTGGSVVRAFSSQYAPILPTDMFHSLEQHSKEASCHENNVEVNSAQGGTSPSKAEAAKEEDEIELQYLDPHFGLCSPCSWIESRE